MVFIPLWVIRRCIKAFINKDNSLLYLCNFLKNIEVATLSVKKPVDCLTFNNKSHAYCQKGTVKVVLLDLSMVLVKAKKEKIKL